MEYSQQTLVEMQTSLGRANGGDRESFSRLIRRFETRLRRLVQQMFHDFPRLKRWEQTDDIYQQAVIRLHQSLDKARPNSIDQFLGLTATQVRRTLLDLSRHHFGALGRGRHHHSETDGRAADDPGAIIEKQTTQVPTTLEQWQDFHEVMEALPEETRRPIELVWYTGLTQDEAARILNVSRRTLIRRLNRARIQLKERLSKLGDPNLLTQPDGRTQGQD